MYAGGQCLVVDRNAERCRRGVGSAPNSSKSVPCNSIIGRSATSSPVSAELHDRLAVLAQCHDEAGFDRVELFGQMDDDDAKVLTPFGVEHLLARLFEQIDVVKGDRRQQRARGAA